ncbi:NAD-glutamate dehydrogenase [Phytophthora cinnamomi]|uniref:NAD-glutamate dehydrogenase n=1 Tax=Phytophthora cinnamomi TaxID=4785 RepID=UPI0035594E73|nr:NAD-glutamate dehydrogenase [Phytophthora cinnamomi]
MRFFGYVYGKRRTQGLNAKLPPPPTPLQPVASKETTIVYTGGALCVKLQRARSRFLEEQRPTRLVWSKNQRLGLTFVEMPQGGVAVKDVPGMRTDISPGQELIGVGKMSVVGKSLQDVVELLHSVRSPCVLDFTPPPSPIVVSEVLGPARLLGVRPGMVLRSVNSSSMIGARLADVSSALRGASDASPVRLTFAPYDTVVHSRARSASLAESPTGSRATLRNTLCIGAVVAAFSV